MPNANRPFGLRPVKSLIAGDWDGRGNIYCIPTSDSTNSYYIGDVVRLGGSADANGIPTVVKTAAGDGGTLGQGAVGVIVGVGKQPYGPFIDPSNLENMNAPATKAVNYYALVADDPFLIYEVQESNSGTPLAAADVGLNANLVITANQTTGKISGTVLGNTAEAVTIGLDVKLLGLKQEPGNAFGAAAKWLVMLNSHAYKAAVTGI